MSDFAYVKTQRRLANLCTNTWTFIPGVAYTKIFPKANVEVSATWGPDFDTENLSARWIHEFDVSKHVEGDAFNFSASLKF